MILAVLIGAVLVAWAGGTSFVSGLEIEGGKESVRLIALPGEPWSIRPPSILVSSGATGFVIANSIPGALTDRAKAWSVSDTGTVARSMDPSLIVDGDWALAAEAIPVSDPDRWGNPSFGRTIEALLSPSGRFVATLSFRGWKLKRPVYQFIGYPDPSARGLSLVDSWTGAVRLSVIDKASGRPVAVLRRTVINARTVTPPARVGLWLPQREGFVIVSELSAGGPLPVVYP